MVLTRRRRAAVHLAGREVGREGAGRCERQHGDVHDPDQPRRDHPGQQQQRVQEAGVLAVRAAQRLPVVLGHPERPVLHSRRRRQRPVGGGGGDLSGREQRLLWLAGVRGRVQQPRLPGRLQLRDGAGERT